MKTKKRVRRLLSLWLSLVMIVSNLAGLMPVLSLTAYAATLDNESTIWSENSVIAGNVTINNNVTVNADITLTIPEGKILTINGQSGNVSYAAIKVDSDCTLTVSGGGTLIVNAPAEEEGHSALVGIHGNLIVDGATVQVTGGAQGVYGNVTVKSGSVCVNGGNGEAGNYGYEGISGDVIVNGGSITVVGGNGGNGDNGDGGSGGEGVIGDVIVNGGSATITGGNGGTKGSYTYASNGYSGQAVYGSITGNAEESEDNTNWTSVAGDTSEKQYIKIEPILVTGVSLDKTTAQTIDVGNTVSFTATVAPDNASDKTVKWSVGGTKADAVTLYSDEACESAVTLDTATETMTVYAKGISAGSATITCTSNADSEKSASCNVTVNAYAGDPYASLVNTTTSVKFNEMDWYIIADDSTAVDAGTVTLLSKDPIGASKFHESENSVYVYSRSLVKDYLDSLTGADGTFEAVADAIVTVKVKGSDSDSEVDAKLWLLSTSEAEGLSVDVRKCSTALSYFWWLRSRGLDPNKAARVYCEDGDVSSSGDNAWYECGVRPALKLDLSKVTFDSNTKIFELMPVVEYPLWVGGVQVTSANNDDVLGDTDEGATVSYDVDTNTLTLNGVDIAEGYEDPYYNSTRGIYYSGNDSLSIVLSADSDNKVGVNGDVQIGIESSRNITISGAGKLTVKGSGNYSVGIEAYALTIKDAEINAEGAFNGIQTQKYGYGVNIISGKVNAIGQTGTGIHSGLRDANYQTSAVTIGENATVVAIGGNKAISYLKNAIAGTGWTDPEDNTSKTTISISSEGQSIDTLKKVAFPELPASTVTTAPEAKDLTFTGSAQELVTAGEASGGTMQYALGTATEATEQYTASIPTATNAGTYYVWYRVVGNEDYTDSDPACVIITISEVEDISYTVIFKVANGSWNDGTTADKTVTLTGVEGDTLKLTAAQIPEVGTKPNDGYKEGSWDVTPVAGSAISGNKTYTYTYAADLPVDTDENTGEGDLSVDTDENTDEADLPVDTDENTGEADLPVDTDENTDEGDLRVDTHVEAGAPECTLSVSDSDAESLLTEEEKAQKEAGKPVRIYLEVKNIDDTVSETDKGLVEEAATEISSDVKVGMYLDLSMFKKVGDAAAVKMTDLNGKKVPARITVPENLRAGGNVTRIFYVVRIHDGKKDILAESTNTTIDVDSDLFSTYAILYRDIEGHESSGDGKTDPCAHGHDYYLWVSPATATRDGRMAWVCWNCGRIDKTHFAEADEDGFVTLPAYPVFQKECAAAITKAQSGTLRIDAHDWISFHRSVFEALEKRSDLEVVVNFKYEGKKYELTIPAGTTAEAALGDELYGGFLYLGSKYGLREL